MKRLILGLSGASGSVIFKRLVETLVIHEIELYLIASTNAERVFEYETDINFCDFISSLNSPLITICDINNMFSKVASGSFKTDGMIIAPCSVGTVGKIAAGTSDSLMIRALDVCLKEKRKTLLVPREAPLSSIHLENLLKLSRMDVGILPPVPAFYTKPTSVEEIVNQIVGRILDYFNIESDLKKSWNGV